MRKRSTVLIHIFSQIHSKQRFRLKMYMYIRSLLSKTCSSGNVFGKFNQIYPCTFNNLTIFNAFSYLRHVKRLGICLPRLRSRSIINIHEIVTSRWWIERCHRRRASGVRVKRDAGRTEIEKQASSQKYNIPKVTVKPYLDNTNKIANEPNKCFGRPCTIPQKLEE